MSQNPFTFAAQILERRWTLRVLRALENRPLRFNAIVKGIPGISTQSLRRVLVMLEKVGLVRRTVNRTRRLGVTYTLLSDLILAQVLWGISDWGAMLLEKRNIQETTDPPAGPAGPLSKRK